MPTYKNTSTGQITFEGRTLAPGETLAVMRCYPTLPVGVERTSAAPIWNPVILSQIESGDENEVSTVLIPATKDGLPVEDFDILISGVAGLAQVQFNDAAFTPPLVVGPGMLAPGLSKPFGVVNRAVESIIITFKANSSQVKLDVIQK